ncbi:hypothetical protein [Flavivirga sp. 57AJ16]|uniref:hypothetical protein n=1 Tax=Flavivirga sp. 57AJ16 TaxID=3025307 RepID=UPI0023651F14|nr:hypothetical protein [Flavivirga sp. 57AJ16]MDD7886130.1 hypothetical protein [Flavivirga sp. 57AJ16]
MERKVAKNIEELIEIWESDIDFDVDDFDEDGNPLSYYADKYSFDKIDIDFDLNLPFSKEVIDDMEMALFQNIGTLRFNNCKFLRKFYIGSSDKDIEFTDNCVFSGRLRSWRYKNNLTFKDSVIKNMDFEDAIFGVEENKNDKKGKVRFHNCDLYEANFRNTTFNSLADFWSCTFHNPITFYKTDFRDIVVFSAVNFKENVLFTYSLIDKLMILREANPEKGFDLSLAIISGKLSVFDFKFDDYNSYGKIYADTNEELYKTKNKISYFKAYETVYERAVSQNNQIPIENKRETYRILKNHLESEKNFINAIPFKVMESKTHLKESYKKLINGHTITRPLSNIIVLFLNAISNWFGSSYIIGVLFTIGIGGLFYYLSILNFGLYEFAWSIDNDIFKENLGAFAQFIIPTHRFDYATKYFGNDGVIDHGFYLWDILGRIFVGYGIYQTIQAFRKYK